MITHEMLMLLARCVFILPGGSIGTVTVTVTIVQSRSTATKSADFTADDATLTFGPGETTRSK